MLTLFRQAFRRYRGSIVGWGLSLGLLGMYVISFYETFAAQQDSLEQLLASYPPEMLAFFGDFTQMFTPEGFLSVEFFSFMPLILGIFAVLAGSGLVAADEENGTLDLLLAHPISRPTLVAGRWLAFVAATTAILGLAWLGLVVGLQSTSLDLSALDLVQPFLSLLSALLFFGALALLLSQLLPSRRLAGLVAGLVLVGSYFVTALARIDDGLETLATLSPLSYYQGGDALLGLNVAWFVGPLALAALFVLLAAWRFNRRDIRVAGEGSARLPLWKARATENSPA